MNQCNPSFISRRAYMALGLAGVLLLGLLASFVGTRPALAATNAPAKPASGGELNFVQSATSANTSGDYTLINQRYLNGNPQALLFVTGDWNPGNNYTGFDYKHVGVWYDTWAQEWGIFNEDSSAMTVGAQFNVLAWTSSVASDGFYIQQAASNSSSYSMFINNPMSNGNLDARVFITASWNPGGSSSGVYDNHAASVWYNSFAGMWEIYHDDTTNIPPDAAYNVYIDNSSFAVTVTKNNGSYACGRTPLFGGRA